MADLTRKLLKIFAGTITPAGNIAQFGSLAASSPAFSGDPDVIQALDAWGEGWQAATIGDGSPPLQDQQAIEYVVSWMLAYLFQKGIPEWLATEQYYGTKAFVQVNGVLYRSKRDNLNKDPLTETDDWLDYAASILPTAALIKAKVCFDGATGNIVGTALNVSSITRTAAGCYIVNFQTALADNAYAWAGSAGTAPGGAPSNGDNNVICGGTPGRTSIKTTAQLSVFAWEANNNRTEDPGVVSVIVI